MLLGKGTEGLDGIVSTLSEESVGYSLLRMVSARFVCVEKLSSLNCSRDSRLLLYPKTVCLSTSLKAVQNEH